MDDSRTIPPSPFCLRSCRRAITRRLQRMKTILRPPIWLPRRSPWVLNWT